MESGHRQPLDGLRIVDGTTGIAGGYCAKLFTDAGADVVKVEHPDGDPLRRWRIGADVPPREDGALFRFLHHGQHAVVVESPRDLDDLLAGADLILCGVDGPTSDAATIVGAQPGAIVVSITPFGLHGPYAGRPASELTIQAEGGGLAIRGDADRPPLQAGGQVIHWVGGAYAAATALAASREVERSGRGTLIDISLCEVANLTETNFFELFWTIGGRPDRATAPPPRTPETPSIEPTVDGYVGFNTNSPDQFAAFLRLIEREDLLASGEWSAPGTRVARRTEWLEIVRAWTTRHTTAEIVERAVALRVPVAPVVDGQGVLALDQVIDRAIMQDDPTGTFSMPRRPWTIDGEVPPAPRPAPSLGADNGSLPAARGPRARRERRPTGPEPLTPPPAPEPSACLAGLRVLDLTTWWAGPSATGLLAALGAEVVHLESPSRMDGVRLVGATFGFDDGWWEKSPFYVQINTNKQDVTIDLGTETGRDLALDLVRWADLVFENYTPRVVDKFGLDWDVVHRENPRATMVRMPAFGLAGPWRDRPGFAQNMEQCTGLAWVTGWPDRAPLIQRGPCDPNGGLHAVLAALSALALRDRTETGHLVEVPLLESALNIAAEVVIEWSAYRNPIGRQGNRDPRAAPQGVYPCRGTEQWLALSVLDTTQWQALCLVPGLEHLGRDDELATTAGRHRTHDRLDEELGRWAAGQDLGDAVDTLIGAGVPAAPAVDPRVTSEQPQMAARGFFEDVDFTALDHPLDGRYPIPTLPLRMTGVERWIRSPAPTLGQHNAEVLRQVAGCDDQQLTELEAAGIIGTRPAGT